VSALALAEATRAPLVQVLAASELETDPIHDAAAFGTTRATRAQRCAWDRARSSFARARTIPPGLDLAALERTLGQRVVVDGWAAPRARWSSR